MDNYFKCSKIESSFKDDKLELPKKGELKLITADDLDFAELFLKIKKDKIYYCDSNENVSLILHKIFKEDITQIDYRDALLNIKIQLHTGHFEISMLQFEDYERVKATLNRLLPQDVQLVRRRKIVYRKRTDEEKARKRQKKTIKYQQAKSDQKAKTLGLTTPLGTLHLVRFRDNQTNKSVKSITIRDLL